jgi:integrase
MRATAQETKSDWVKAGPCLYRYKGATYYALFKVGGKQIRRSLETSDLELARRRVRQLRNDLDNSTAARSKLTLDDMAARYLDTVRGKPSTVKHKGNAVRLLLSDWPQDAPRDLFKIRRSHLETWLAAYKGKASSTVNDYISTARAIFDQAVDDGELAVSPALGVKYWKREKPIRLTPTYEQFQAIMADLRHPDRHNTHGQEETADYIEIAGEAGLGQGEISGLRRCDIDLAGGTMTCFRMKTVTGFAVPIYPKARPIIERRLARVPPEPEARLFSFDNCKKAIEAACRRLGFPHFTLRSLRRMFITRALMRGVDVQTVSRWQGHVDGGALLLRTYAHVLSREHSLKMANLMGDEPANIPPTGI